jgi:Cof subfamily protein (haloacid dehalogenase superfamily)
MDYSQIDLRDYQLIAFDIDGTLMDMDHVIHPLTRNTLFRLRDAGFPFTLATGKSLAGTISQADALEVDLPLVLINGGMLQTRRGEVLHAVTLPEAIVSQVVDLCERHQRDLVMYIDDGIYFKEMNENIYPVYGHLTAGLRPIGAWHTITDRFSRVNKCLVVDSTDRQNLIEMGRLFEAAFQNTVDILHTSTYLVEVMPRGVTKVTGLTKLTDSMGIPLSRVMAFGDFDNDAEMLSAVGLGVAVSNASPRAKEAAHLIIGAVNEQGPAHFLIKLLDRLPKTKKSDKRLMDD